MGGCRRPFRSDKYPSRVEETRVIQRERDEVAELRAYNEMRKRAAAVGISSTVLAKPWGVRVPNLSPGAKLVGAAPLSRRRQRQLSLDPEIQALVDARMASRRERPRA